MPTWLERALIVAPFMTLCLNEREYVEALRTFNEAPQGPWVIEGSDATTHILSAPGKDDVCIVCLKAPPDADGVMVAGMLVHEAVHIWQTVRRQINEREPSPEFEAYSVQTISQQLMWEYARRRNKD